MKRLFFIALIILIVLNTFSQNSQFYEDLSDAKLKAGDYQYALTLIEKAIALNDTDQWLVLKKAEIEFQLYGLRTAIETVNKAIRLDPKASEPFNRAATYYQLSGRIDTSLVLFDKAIGLAKTDTIKFSYIMNRGTAKAAHRDFEGARQDYEQVLQFDPEDIGTLNNIASVYRQLDMVDKAIMTLKKVIFIDSTLIGPYVNLGFTYSNLDSLDLAIKYFDLASLIDPDQSLVYNNRGYVYYKKGEYSKALENINRSISLYPTNSYAYRNLALVYIKQNKMREACNALHFAMRYGFTEMYGTEVEELIDKNCKN